MSDLTGNAQRFSSVSHLALALNSALLATKREQLGLPALPDAKPQEASDARQTLAAIAQIMALLLEGAGPEAREDRVPSAAFQVPAAFLRNLRERWRGDLPWRVDDLRTIADQLLHGQELTDAQLALLDELARAAESEASRAFRSMMRRP